MAVVRFNLQYDGALFPTDKQQDGEHKKKRETGHHFACRSSRQNSCSGLTPRMAPITSGMSAVPTSLPFPSFLAGTIKNQESCSHGFQIQEGKVPASTRSCAPCGPSNAGTWQFYRQSSLARHSSPKRHRIVQARRFVGPFRTLRAS